MSRQEALAKVIVYFGVALPQLKDESLNFTTAIQLIWADERNWQLLIEDLNLWHKLIV